MSPVSSAMYVSVRLAEFASGLQPRIEPRVGKVSTVWQSDSVHGLLGKFVLELPKAAFPWNTLKSFFMAVEMHLRPAWRSPTSLHVQKWLKRAHCHTCHTIQNASKCQPCVQAGWAAHVLHICSCHLASNVFRPSCSAPRMPAQFRSTAKTASGSACCASRLHSGQSTVVCAWSTRCLHCARGDTWNMLPSKKQKAQKPTVFLKGALVQKLWGDN